jgi:hypothetical protein
MSQGKSGKSIIPSGKEIGFMVVRGFGLFLSVSGMAGIALVLGPLNSIIKDLTFTPIFDSKGYAFLFCLLMAVVGGRSGLFRQPGPQTDRRIVLSRS